MNLTKNIRACWSSLVFLAMVLVPRIVFANGGGSGGGLRNPLENVPDLQTFIQKALEVARNIGFLVAIFFLVYAGFLFVTARGDETQLKKAKSAFMWAVVGTAVVLGAWLFAEAIKGSIESL